MYLNLCILQKEYRNLISVIIRFIILSFNSILVTMALLNLNIHSTVWYHDIVFPLSSSQRQICAVYFDFNNGVDLSSYAVPVHSLGLFWPSCGFMNSLRSFFSGCRLVTVICSVLKFFSVLPDIPKGSFLRTLCFKISVSQ